MLKSLHFIFVRALVALLLTCGAGAALAGPIYRVSLDTGAWSGSGYLSLTLSGLSKEVPVSASLSNFAGSYGAASFTQGQVAGDVASTVSLVQGPSFNELLQQIDFGGLFSFDVSFTLAPGVLDGAVFGVALVDAGQSGYVAGTAGDIANIFLMPGQADALLTDARFVDISEVPEPGGGLLVALGLLLAGWSRARSVRVRR